ncbi:MAG: transglycosylase SLT domain-containing protein [Halothiobacillus sp.]
MPTLAMIQAAQQQVDMKMNSDRSLRNLSVRWKRLLLPIMVLTTMVFARAHADANVPKPTISPATTHVTPNVITDWTPPPAFLAGMAAIAQGDSAAVDAAIAALKDNPLATYLRFRFLLDPPTSDPAPVIAFLQAHPDYVFSAQLKSQTLNRLISKQQFADYQLLQAVAPELKSNRRLSCQGWQAALALGTLSAQQVKDAEQFWAQGRNQPSYCDPIFKWLRANDKLTPNLYRQRIQASMIAGNPSFASYLVRDGTSRKISGLDTYFKRWDEARQDPQSTLQQALKRYHSYPGHDEQALLIQAFKWLGRSDPQAAHDLLAQLPKSWQIKPDEQAEIARVIALKAAYTRMPQAYDWLMALPESVQDKETRTWTARAALRAEDWARLKVAINTMPVDLSQTPQWQYWLARADAELGKNQDAKARWQALVHTPNYYGLLAADRLGIAYPWPKIPPLPVMNTREVEKNPTVQLAFYLHAAGLTDDARRAFLSALNEIPPEQIPALTLLAEQSKWHDRVSIAIARMNKQDDPHWFSARFPTPWESTVDAQAKAQGIASNWLYGVIRRESLFMSDVGSGAGAQGLMQLMPNTARWINRKADLGLTTMNLHDPKTSITLGAAYLSYLKDKFNGQLPLAIAAYNAGPGRVRQWLPEDRNLPGDVWVDTILFDETRNYVRAVLSATMIYAWRESMEPESNKSTQNTNNLLSLLTPVQASNPTTLSSVKSADTIVADRVAGN